MKIIYLYTSLAITGGVERVLVDKMNYLVSHGYDVYMITSDQGKHPLPYQLDERVHLYDLQIRFHSQYRYRGLHRIKEGRRLNRLYNERLKVKIDNISPDIIVCTTSQDICGLFKIKGNIPLVVESHVNFFQPGSWINHIRTLLNNYQIGKANIIITLTLKDANNWRYVSRNVHVIPNIVHLNDTRQYSDCSKKRAIFVGRLERQKGLPDLIKVWRTVHQRYPDWQLDVFGNGQMDSIPEIKLFVHSPSKNIMDEYINSSMLLMTSVFEPFGLVIPEAMSCGLPVVAFDCPYGPADIITDRVDGFLIKERNIDKFAQRVGLLICNPELRRQMGQAGIQSSLRYQASRIMPQWQALFKSLIRS